jgi:hypothetical protein
MGISGARSKQHRRQAPRIGLKDQIGAIKPSILSSIRSDEVSSSESKLKSKIKDVLNEARILVLGTQVLLGFQFQAVFYPGFARLPSVSQWANYVSLVLEILVLGLLLAPAPYHRIADDGDDSTDLEHLTAQMIGLALPLLAGSLGLDLALISVRTIGDEAAIAVGAATILAASTLWIVMGLINRNQPKAKSIPKRETAPLSEKIETLLTEARVILPGVQALLGFQCAAMLTDKFDTLPHVLRLIHVASLFMIATSVILLIAPAAYHRLAASGEPRPDVDSFGAKSVLGSLIPLALALCGDLYIVTAMQTASALWASIAAAIAFAGFALLWGAFPIIARHSRIKI